MIATYPNASFYHNLIYFAYIFDKRQSYATYHMRYIVYQRVFVQNIV